MSNVSGVSETSSVGGSGARTAQLYRPIIDKFLKVKLEVQNCRVQLAQLRHELEVQRQIQQQVQETNQGLLLPLLTSFQTIKTKRSAQWNSVLREFNLI